VGSLIPRKNPVTLVKGFLESKANENSILLVIGDGPLKSNIYNMVKDSKHIMLKGQIFNVSDFLKASDYFISVSLSEGLPNTVLEAMSTGLPVCLSNIPPHTEILDYNNTAGVLTDVEHYKMLSSKINTILRKDYKK